MSEAHSSIPCLLIVDDYDDFRQTLAALLKLKGYKVETAAHGEEALSIMRDRKRIPDLVITDLRMPHDGWFLRRRMLEDDELAAIPVIVVSSTDARGSEEELQAVAYIEKPVRSAELIEAIDKHSK